MNPDELQQMMERAQQMQARMGEIQKQLEARRFEASSGGGMVTAVVSGALRVLSIEIEPSLLGSGDRTMLQDLVDAAVNAALVRAQESVQEEIGKMQQSMWSGLGG